MEMKNCFMETHKACPVFSGNIIAEIKADA
jgi:hypothetical protein